MITVPIVSTFNPKGLSKAERAFKSFGTSVGRYLGVAAIAKFGQVSLKAFGDNQKQVAILTNTLKNLGQEYRAAGVNDFVDKLSLASGVTKEQLVPAFQGLFISLGDVNKAQDALKLAMDISAGTGKDLHTVQVALSKAYLGNYTSLTRLGAGLSKTLLKTGDMQAITAQLAATFKGDAATAAESFTGKMDRLKASAKDAEVIIGGGLVDALTQLTGSGDLTKFQDAFHNAAQEVANIITGLGVVASKISAINSLSGGWLFKLVKSLYDTSPVGYLGSLGANANAPKPKPFSGAMSVSGASDYYTGMDKATAAKLAKQKKDELAALKAKNAATALELQQKKDQAALDALKAKFDLERIGITKALADATDAETKARLQAMLAILDANAAEVKTANATLTAEMKKTADANAALSLSTLSAAGSVVQWASALEKSRESGAFQLAGQTNNAAANAVVANASVTAGTQFGNGKDATYDAMLAAVLAATKALTDAAAKQSTVVVKTDLPSLVTVVQDAVITNNRYGNNSFQAGAIAV